MGYGFRFEFDEFLLGLLFLLLGAFFCIFFLFLVGSGIGGCGLLLVLLFSTKIFLLNLLVGFDSEPEIEENRLDVAVEYREVVVLEVHRDQLSHALREAVHLEFLCLHFLECHFLVNLPSNLLPLVRPAHVVQIRKMQLDLEKEVLVQVLGLDVDFGAEENDVVYFDLFFAVADEEHLGAKGGFGVDDAGRPQVVVVVLGCGRGAGVATCGYFLFLEDLGLFQHLNLRNKGAVGLRNYATRFVLGSRVFLLLGGSFGGFGLLLGSCEGVAVFAVHTALYKVQPLVEELNISKGFKMNDDFNEGFQ